mmetsp:Transcript_20984/g.44027  ORF Transcript_20984/g.44027 Transcript_20984/m.44027 type:complete len:337 (+) Transcript_20984:403-1413(+)
MPRVLAGFPILFRRPKVPPIEPGPLDVRRRILFRIPGQPPQRLGILRETLRGSRGNGRLSEVSPGDLRGSPGNRTHRRNDAPEPDQFSVAGGDQRLPDGPEGGTPQILHRVWIETGPGTRRCLHGQQVQLRRGIRGDLERSRGKTFWDTDCRDPCPLLRSIILVSGRDFRPHAISQGVANRPGLSGHRPRAPASRGGCTTRDDHQNQRRRTRRLLRLRLCLSEFLSLSHRYLRHPGQRAAEFRVRRQGPRRFRIFGDRGPIGFGGPGRAEQGVPRCLSKRSEPRTIQGRSFRQPYHRCEQRHRRSGSRGVGGGDGEQQRRRSRTTRRWPDGLWDRY